MKLLMKDLFDLQTLELKSTRPSPADKKAMAELRERIPVPILGHYDRLRSRGKKGISAVRNSVCSGCHMRLPTGVVATLMHGDDVQLCGNCGRYLYLPEPEPEEAKPLTAPKRSAVRKKKASVAEYAH